VLIDCPKLLAELKTFVELGLKVPLGLLKCGEFVTLNAVI